MGKRKRCVGFDDYIKEDGVLSMIVSKLPIREAIRTSVLSRRWRYIWNHMPNLHFTLRDISVTYNRKIPHLHSSFQGYKTSILYRTPKFVHAVNAVLIHHCGSGVETFKIKFSFRKEHTSSVDKWLDFALASDTKSLDLNFHGSECPNSYSASLKWLHLVPGLEPYNFPFHKLLQQNRSSSTLSSIHTLRLGYCSLQVPSSDCNRLPFLKTIDLYCLNISDLDFENLLSICSDIEHLSVCGCPRLVNMSIHQQSGRLKHLSVRICPSLKRLHIQVACLATFEYQGEVIELFTDVSHITKASFAFRLYLKYSKYIMDLSSHLPRCQDLTLEFDHGRVYCPTEALINKFEHLKHLTVRMEYLDVGYILLLFKILKAAPVLEKFELQLLYLKKLYMEELPLEGENLPLEYLKEVNIIGFAGKMEQITFVRSLFRNLRTLSTMRIIVQLQQFIDLKLNFDAREVIFDGVLAFDYLRSVAPPHVDLVLQYPILSESDSRMLQSLRSSTHQIHKLSFSN